MARVPYATIDTAPPKVADLFRKIEANGAQLLNLYRAVGLCEELGPAFIRLGNKILFRGKLPPRLRELAILWVGHRAQAPYEFTKHVAIGLQTGLTQAQIDALPDWQTSPLFDTQARAVLAFTDEVSGGYRAQEATFAALKAFLDDEQVVELTVIVGFYEMVCRLLEALQIELEDEEFQPLGKVQ
ncbi:MAG TPA: carboxymuconolactone decarboxylase family protein [bacterium]|nr:carboxymuconolactone decarboxylase family protein [bacterium]